MCKDGVTSYGYLELIIHQGATSMTPLANTTKIYSDREKLAAHKFHQRQIMAKAARRNLVVHYYKRKWKFLDPETGQEHFTTVMDDEKAIAWLDNFSKPKVIN